MPSKVLITGGTGFVGSHIIQQLIDQGYEVLAAVRSQEKGKELCSHFNEKVSFGIVEDITAPGSFDNICKNGGTIDYVIHSASPFVYGHSDPEKEILQPAIQGSLEILRSVMKWAPSVKQVVLTSSLASMIGDASAQGVFKETHWNPITYEQSLQPENTYIGSKKLAEKKAWEFMSENPGAHFSLTTINPGLIFGPLILPVSSEESVNTSNQLLDELVRGQHTDKVPDAPVPAWVDIRDVALAHVRAIQFEAARDHRFILVNDIYTMDEVVEIMRRQFPILRGRLPEPQETPRAPIQFESSKSQKILGIKYHSLEDCVVTTTKSLMKKNGI
ncbi:hypothetical protein PENSTE_c001G07950 [Penicillium steckii]|uniref:NAD-dependent epimerase/dehydratase domain-containing protein n=1 Tax=Penicillium steckii TaxID=303698 RepID=A0A1V6U028_9EURO|nr:hypothetical protein PENSTE_c001G07950 [Penicillium steckii]